MHNPTPNVTNTKNAIIRLSPTLQRLLDAELAYGNTVVEVTHWLPKCELLIILALPFHQSYLLLSDVTFVEINDPHYWKSEYRYNEGKQVLACRFG
jgi:hypothetical protein